MLTKLRFLTPVDEFLISIARNASGIASIQWNEDKAFDNEERCIWFFVYLGGSYDVSRVLVEKSDGTFETYHEIKGPFNEWREARFKLHQSAAKNETIYFEAASNHSQNNLDGAFAIDNVANLP